MFPDGGHYGGAGKRGEGKVNEMLAYRSSNKGKTWEGPTVAFDIDYNQHGFIPFIPKSSERIYAFGTQPIWDMYEPETYGLSENAPIGYRYSDDDGKSWTYPKPTPLVHPDAPPMLFMLSDGKTLTLLATDLSITTAPKSGSRPLGMEVVTGANRNSCSRQLSSPFSTISGETTTRPI